MVTTLYSLISLLFNKYIPKNNIALALVDVLLIILAIGVIILAYKKWQELRKNGAAAAA
jgi:uncharacterized membrane protein YidH (DUF202 family)